MLTPADMAVIDRDPRLPGLRALLDTEILSDRLADRWPPARNGSLRCVYIRYKPHTNCLAAYEVESDNGPVRLYAKAFTSGANPKFRKATAASADGIAIGPGPVVLTDDAIVLRFFPHDDRLMSLSALADPDARRRLLRKLLPDQPAMWDAALVPLRYKPERRFVARLDAPDGAQAVVRCYTAREYAAAKSHTFRSTGPVRIPRRLGQSRRHAVLAFEWLPGRRADVSHPGSMQSVMYRIGESLAELHLLESHGLRVVMQRDEAAALRAAASTVAFLCPDLADRSRWLARELASLHLAAPPVFTPIHGDFYGDQILESDGRIAFVDLDEAAIGDPATDVGNFLAHLDRRNLRNGGIAADGKSPAESFLAGYREASAQRTDRVDMHHAAALLRLAPQPFRDREPDWPRKVALLLSRVEEIIDLAGPRRHRSPAAVRVKESPLPSPAGCTALPERGVEIVDPFHVVDDPKLSFVAGALEPDEVIRRFRHSLPHFFGACRDPASSRALSLSRRPVPSLRAIRVKRHKPGRRCLIEYEFETVGSSGDPGCVALIGKVHARCLDLLPYRIHQSLFHSLPSGEGEGNTRVPEPLGAIPKWQMWLQRKVAGKRATRLFESDSGPRLAGSIADAIHRLHHCAVPLRRSHTMFHELRILQERLPQVAHHMPGLRVSIGQVFDRCSELGNRLSASPPRLIHRDFYPDQVLVDGDAVCVVDWDLCCLGDPALDVGNFHAHLTEQSLRRIGSPDALADCQTALVERYVELAGESIRPRIDVYANLSLARHIYLSTRYPDRRPLTETLVELCRERLQCRTRSRMAVRE